MENEEEDEVEEDCEVHAVGVRHGGNKEGGGEEGVVS